jgi:hypothetical protein
VILIDSRLPKFLWAQAVHHGIWIQNRSPTWTLSGKTPYETRKGQVPDLSQVPPLGTHAWVKIHGAGKLVPRAQLGYFVGMDNESTGFTIYFPEQRIVNVECEVAFDRSKGDDSITIDIEATPAPSEINDKIRENPLEPEIVPLEDELKHSHRNTCSTATGLSLCYEIQCYRIQNHLEYIYAMESGI